MGSRWYLQPEPLLSPVAGPMSIELLNGPQEVRQALMSIGGPSFIVGQAKKGLSTPMYAYANNNPIRFSDPTGLKTTCTYNPADGGMDCTTEDDRIPPAPVKWCKVCKDNCRKKHKAGKDACGSDKGKNQVNDIQLDQCLQGCANSGACNPTLGVDD